jgi:hypothetical protein
MSLAGVRYLVRYSTLTYAACATVKNTILPRPRWCRTIVPFHATRSQQTSDELASRTTGPKRAISHTQVMHCLLLGPDVEVLYALQQPMTLLTVWGPNRDCATRAPKGIQITLSPSIELEESDRVRGVVEEVIIASLQNAPVRAHDAGVTRGQHATPSSQGMSSTRGPSANTRHISLTPMKHSWL